MLFLQRLLEVNFYHLQLTLEAQAGHQNSASVLPETDSCRLNKDAQKLLCSQVVPMLPRLLCEELCSLNPMTDKLTFSVIWKLTPEGKVTNCTLSFILRLPLSHPVCHGKHPLCACTRLKFHNGWMQKVWGNCCREDILGL